MTETAEITQKAAVDALIGLLERYARDHTPPLGTMPDGIRLEMHPATRHMILRHWTPGYTQFITGQEMPTPPKIPVKIDMDLPEYGWRLVVVTEDVINGGIMPVTTA